MKKKHLLIVYHSKTGKMGLMAEAVLRGTKHDDIDVEVSFKKAKVAGVEDLLKADGIIFGTPENFGYMSGALKDFFDRTFYEVEEKVEGMPYCIVVGAGNDGSGALSAIRRICAGYKFKEVQKPIVVVGELQDYHLTSCEELGLTMAAGLDAGVF